MMDAPEFDVAIIGAGMAGLTCAQRLQQVGYRVVVIEKSRGVGGRMATRRLHGTFADHGTCYLSPSDVLFRRLVDDLVQAGVLQTWPEDLHEMGSDGRLCRSRSSSQSRFAALKGMTAIAKFLATGLDVRLMQRVTDLSLVKNQYWQLTAETISPEKSGFTKFLARAVVVAIPAPQAAMLLQPLAGNALSMEFMSKLESVRFSPCLSAIAGYADSCYQDWLTQYSAVHAIRFSHDPSLAWIGLDSSKRSSPSQPVFVIQSTAAFAENFLDVADLQPVGHQLLEQAAKQLAPWLSNPEWLQVHRWRFAFTQTPLSDSYLTASSPVPLACAGDWCGGTRVEHAFLSGWQAAEAINLQIQQLAFAPVPFWKAIQSDRQSVAPL